MKSNRKPILVIDLDETLVHCCNFDGPYAKYETIVTYASNKSSQMIAAKMNIRPRAAWFLKQISKYYQVVVYTASDMDYAKAMCKYLDPLCQYVVDVLSRSSCLKTEKGFLVKDLRMISNSDTNNVVLVDNSPCCFAPQINNGIPILPYLSGNMDDELSKLYKFLVSIKNSPSKPDYLKKYFGLAKLSRCGNEKEVATHMERIGSMIF